MDSGHPRLSGLVTVTIDILDANDNAPQFTLDNYTAVVQVRRSLTRWRGATSLRPPNQSQRVLLLLVEASKQKQKLPTYD